MVSLCLEMHCQLLTPATIRTDGRDCLWHYRAELPKAACLNRHRYMQDGIATSTEHAASSAAVGISSPSTRPHPLHSLEEMPLVQRLGALRAKLAAPYPPNASASDTITALMPNPAACQQQEPIMSSTTPAQVASPGPRPALTCPPAKKARRLVPILSIPGQAQESSSAAGHQNEIPAEGQPEAAPAATRSDLMSVFSFL